MYYTSFSNLICPITLIGDEDGLLRLYMHSGDAKYPLTLEDEWLEQKTFFTDAINQINAFTHGQRRTFDLKLNPQGTTYQKKVWHALTKIPYGEFRSYKDLAIACGNPKASRAVGSAIAMNPLPIILPCHRIIGKDGSLTGYAFGLNTKKKLLELEASNS